MAESLTLECPIRGVLKATPKSKSGLKPTEEFFRVQAIKYLLGKGYPQSHFKIEAVVKRFGNSARNSMRADFAVLDRPIAALSTGDVNSLLKHAILLCEVKRDNAASDYVKNNQVEPLLDFAKDDKCLALYWDNVDQRVFWTTREKGKRVVHEGALALLPKYGRDIKLKPLSFNDTKATDNLIGLFDRIADLLHQTSVDLDQRFSVMLQLILTKLYDEHLHEGKPSEELEIQDYATLGYTPSNALKTFNAIVTKAVRHYQMHLPRNVDQTLPTKVTGDTLLEICKILSPIRLTASRRDVIQAFYMKFAKGLYKWDLAQFFTPPTVTDFIVDILNPQSLERIKDPACGSADFLTAAFHKRRYTDHNYADCIWGADNSKNAVQVAVLNMLLNGDGKSNIKEMDSLAMVDAERDRYDILVCNPPFGVRIKETNKHTLRKFDLGHEWQWDENLRQYEIATNKALLDSQETGILFAEACVLQTKPGGRIGIILPNGYLANRSKRYHILREWLLRQCRLVAICSFPRFTFKTSGADVSASVLYFEKRDTPLELLTEDDSYRFSVQLIQNVGWNLGDKKAAPRYLRNREDGSYLVGEDGNRLLDADFAALLDDLRSSAATQDFPWLTAGLSSSESDYGWSVPIKNVLSDDDLTIDPKRFCRKFVELRNKLRARNHHLLGGLVDFIPERRTKEGHRVTRVKEKTYAYVELQDIGSGEFGFTELLGWELPDRAKHFAEGGDIYLGSIWGSVSKWCMIPNDAKSVIVTNGCHRVRVKKDQETYLPDLVAFLCSEQYAIQMRGFARGSDGLAEVTEDDAAKVIIPSLSEEARTALRPYILSLLSGTPDLRSKVNVLTHDKTIQYPPSSKRPSHVVLV